MLLEIIDIAKYANAINDFVLFDKTVKKLCDMFDKYPPMRKMMHYCSFHSYQRNLSYSRMTLELKNC